MYHLPGAILEPAKKAPDPHRGATKGMAYCWNRPLYFVPEGLEYLVAVIITRSIHSLSRYQGDKAPVTTVVNHSKILQENWLSSM